MGAMLRFVNKTCILKMLRIYVCYFTCITICWSLLLKCLQCNKVVKFFWDALYNYCASGLRYERPTRPPVVGAWMGQESKLRCWLSEVEFGLFKVEVIMVEGGGGLNRTMVQTYLKRNCLRLGEYFVLYFVDGSFYFRLIIVMYWISSRLFLLLLRDGVTYKCIPIAYSEN